MGSGSISAPNNSVHDLRDTTRCRRQCRRREWAPISAGSPRHHRFLEIIALRTPFFIAGVVTLSFLLLMSLYRSLLIPFKAARNLILDRCRVRGGDDGLPTGLGRELIGADGSGPDRVRYVPDDDVRGAVRLSFDHEVFLATAFREHWGTDR